MRRGQLVELEEGLRARVLVPEDPLVYKLIAWRNKDRAPIERLLAVQGNLDWAYVRRWSESYGVLERLRQAWRDADIPEPPAG
ncbi:MAG: hypothetical protein HYZ53_31200 [Planctomycetes bacterium]|nr:hypothetical protein [Planctomycetota bacterium]